MPEATHTEQHFGTIVLLGKPNAGKSTLLNALVGTDVAIVSRKPQTTWAPVVGILTEDLYQLVFIDPPGVMSPTKPMHQALLESVGEVLTSADAALYLVPLNGTVSPLEELLPESVRIECPVLTVRTKADSVHGTAGPHELAVSAKNGSGIEPVLSWCREKVSQGPFRYDEDDIGTQPLRFFATEYIREGAFRRLGQELPYAVAVEVEEFRENSDPVYIRATVYVERESQKGMVVGSGGKTIRAIGTHARQRMESLVGERVYLDLRVKVRKDWTSDPAALKRFGYSTKSRKRKEK